MGYYVRAFCTSTHKPSLKTLIDWAASQGYYLFTSDEVDLQTEAWTCAEIYYRKDKSPILIEINTDDSGDWLMNQEIEEFKEALSEIKGIFNFGKNKVIKHLNNTRFIVANQILTVDFDDDGYHALQALLRYFVKYCGGMIQYDGEGFYVNHELIVKIQ